MREDVEVVLGEGCAWCVFEEDGGVGVWAKEALELELEPCPYRWAVGARNEKGGDLSLGEHLGPLVFGCGSGARGVSVACSSLDILGFLAAPKTFPKTVL